MLIKFPENHQFASTDIINTIEILLTPTWAFVIRDLVNNPNELDELMKFSTKLTLGFACTSVFAPLFFPIMAIKLSLSTVLIYIATAFTLPVFSLALFDYEEYIPKAAFYLLGGPLVLALGLTWIILESSLRVGLTALLLAVNIVYDLIENSMIILGQVIEAIGRVAISALLIGISVGLYTVANTVGWMCDKSVELMNILPKPESETDSENMILINNLDSEYEEEFSLQKSLNRVSIGFFDKAIEITREIHPETFDSFNEYLSYESNQELNMYSSV